LPDGIESHQVDIWFQDESRIGQQGSTSRMWAKKGTRPRALKQQQFTYAYLYGAICPSTEQAVALVLPSVNTVCMSLHIDEIFRSIPEGRHALILMDGAGWHQESHNRHNVSILRIPPYSPELNPCEQVWQYIKDKWLKNRCYDDYDDILTVTCDAWKGFIAEDGRVKSLCARTWAEI
jgi:transposase